MVPTTLTQIQERLRQKSASVELIESSLELPFPHLRINLGFDSQKRALFALMWLFSPSQKGIKDQLLQIFIPFPFGFIESALLPTALTLLRLNKVTPFPGLGLSEPDRSLYYKYTLTFPEGGVRVELIENFLGAALLLVDSHTPQIEAIASGQDHIN